MGLFDLFRTKPQTGTSKMYDNFEPFRDLKPQDFLFSYVKYEVWQSGKKIKEGKTPQQIQALIDSSGRIKVSIVESNLNSEIPPYFYFDKLKTLKDRLQLISIPPPTDTDCIGLDTLRKYFGITQSKPMYTSKVPYCCSLFLKNGLISKLTISTNNPEKLIEFYAEERINVDKKIVFIGIVIISLLIDDYDSDGAYFGAVRIKERAKEDLGINISVEEIQQAIEIINSIFPKCNDIIKKPLGQDTSIQNTVIFSNYSKEALNQIFNSLKVMAE